MNVNYSSSRTRANAEPLTGGRGGAGARPPWGRGGCVANQGFCFSWAVGKVLAHGHQGLLRTRRPHSAAKVLAHSQYYYAKGPIGRKKGCQSFASHRLSSALIGFHRLFYVCFFGLQAGQEGRV
jgi:hypothetical protein